MVSRSHSTVHVVTDSTSAISSEEAGKYPHLQIVPLTVIVGDEVCVEGQSGLTERMNEALADKTAISTSQPSPGQFLQAYQRAADAGAKHIVSIHLSAELSGTVHSAQLAAHNSPVPVEVIDSRQVGMGLGYAALQAAERASSSGLLTDVVQRARQVAATSRTIFFVDDLEHLRAGGRLSSTASTIGTMLGVKPLLEVRAGAIVVVQKARSRTAAIRRLQDVIIESAARRKEPVIAIHHFEHDDVAYTVRDQLRVQTSAPIDLVPIGAVLGAHAGPGVIAFVVSDIDG